MRKTIDAAPKISHATSARTLRLSPQHCEGRTQQWLSSPWQLHAAWQGRMLLGQPKKNLALSPQTLCWLAWRAALTQQPLLSGPKALFPQQHGPVRCPATDQCSESHRLTDHTQALSTKQLEVNRVYFRTALC